MITKKLIKTFKIRKVWKLNNNKNEVNNEIRSKDIYTHRSFNIAFESNKEVKRFKRCFKILQINLTNVILLHFYKTKY